MRKVIVLGCPGSGKTIFSGKLEEYTRLPLFHLDNMWWKPDKTHVSRSEFDEMLALNDPPKMVHRSTNIIPRQ